MVSSCSADQGASIDMRIDLLRSPAELKVAWPEATSGQNLIMTFRGQQIHVSMRLE